MTDRLPTKICAECFTVLPSASHQCHGCGNMQPCWYRRQEKLGYDAKAALRGRE